MSPQRRTALISVIAACVLIALKLGTGLATGSLGLISEAVHSGTDLVAALLTLFAVGVAGRPADRGHPYGHGKAEHLAALGEAGLLVLASLYISFRALEVLVGSAEPSVDPVWYAFLVVAIVIAVDASRTAVSLSASRRYHSAALAANAVHFGSDLAGSTAVLAGLALARAGWAEGDSAAALFVAVLVLIAAGRLMRRNVDVLMDRVPVDAEPTAGEAALRERVHAAALTVPRVREVHNLRVVAVDDGLQVALHLKLPGELTLESAHAVASQVEQAIGGAVPEVVSVQTHLEPLREPGMARAPAESDVEDAAEAVARIVRERTGAPPRELRFLQTEDGLMAFLTLVLDPSSPLADAHAQASEVEHEIRQALPSLADVSVHTEP